MNKIAVGTAGLFTGTTLCPKMNEVTPQELEIILRDMSTYQDPFLCKGNFTLNGTMKRMKQISLKGSIFEGDLILDGMEIFPINQEACLDLTNVEIRGCLIIKSLKCNQFKTVGMKIGGLLIFNLYVQEGFNPASLNISAAK